jgi:beta-fructofuranosidase
MQYFKPPGDFFVGDCMPFYHDGTFHLYYLLDENHHQGKGGLGGHQWAHASTRDLVHWEHHPLALAIEHEWEASICTGSVFYDCGVFYAYYATRYPDWSEHLSMATSADGIHFAKSEPNPFASPEPPYRPGPFRDPIVFRDAASGTYHLLATAELAGYPLPGRGGCLAHFTGGPREWRQEGPFYIPGYAGHQPECADYFEWHGWYYLIFSHLGVAHYRMARGPFGSWECPAVDTFDAGHAVVMKTAAFTGDRRLGVAFLASPPPHRYAGNAVFRELIQHADGTLGTRFPSEMSPVGGDALPLRFAALTGEVRQHDDTLGLCASTGLGVACTESLPRNLQLTVRVQASAASFEIGLHDLTPGPSPAGEGRISQPAAASFEVGFRGSGAYEDAHVLRFEPSRGRVGWTRPGAPVNRTMDAEEQERAAIYGVTGLDRPFDLEVVLKDDIADVCIDNRRTLIARLPHLDGDRLFIAARDGGVTFEGLRVEGCKLKVAGL